MPDSRNYSGFRTTDPAEVVQVPPKGLVRSYDEMNTGSMVFELQGTVGELKEAVADLRRTMNRVLDKIQVADRSSQEVKDTLRILAPKIDDVAGFVKHRGPSLADKQDISALRSEIDRRPTRRQAIVDIAWIVGLIATSVTFGSRLTH
jgi:hypothetical protein